MKKFLLLAALALGALAVSAQSVGGGRSSGGNSFFSTEKADHGVTFGIRGGLNVAGLSAEFQKGFMEADDYSMKNGIGFNAGINVDIPIVKSFYVKSGLYWTMKSSKIEYQWYDKGVGYTDIKLNPMFIEIPLLASYRYDFNEKIQLQVNVGPYFAYGIAGKWKDGDHDADTYNLFSKTKETLYGRTFETPKIMNPFDVGLNIGAGITINRIFFGISYEKGFSNLAHKSNDEIFEDIKSIKTHNFSVNIGYDF